MQKALLKMNLGKTRAVEPYKKTNRAPNFLNFSIYSRNSLRKGEKALIFYLKFKKKWCLKKVLFIK